MRDTLDQEISFIKLLDETSNVEKITILLV